MGPKGEKKEEGIGRVFLEKHVETMPRVPQELALPALRVKTCAQSSGELGAYMVLLAHP